MHDLQGLAAAFGVGLISAEVGGDLILGFGDRFRQESYVLMGILDGVKRGLGNVHERELRVPDGSAINLNKTIYACR